MCVRVCVRRACVRVCECACVRACVRKCVRVCAVHVSLALYNVNGFTSDVNGIVIIVRCCNNRLTGA